ncbi:MAG: carbohydrate ABC transporter permease [Treponema sp.]|nr:carbohydrate ABC transporter permease [Treponema sp.]
MKRNNHFVAMIVLVLFSVVLLFPFYWLIRSSLMTDREINTVPLMWLPKTFMWENFPKALSTAPFATYYRNTLTIVVINVVGNILSCSFVAFGFARLRFKGRGFWFALLLSTMMIPGAVTMIPSFIMWKTVGAFNTFLPLTIPAFFGGGAFNIFLVRQFYYGIPKDYDESAFVDGANYFTIYSRILLPLAKPVLCTIGVFTFMGAWNDFLGPLLYLDKTELRTVTLGLYVFIGQYVTKYNYLLAASTVATIPMIIMFFFAQRFFIQGVTFTGLKG